jgi:hypothetical protein
VEAEEGGVETEDFMEEAEERRRSGSVVASWPSAVVGIERCPKRSKLE